MLNIETLVSYKDTLNIKHLCTVSDVCYSTLTKKILRHLKNSENGKLNPKEAEKLTRGLKILKIEFLP